MLGVTMRVLEKRCEKEMEVKLILEKGKINV